MLVDAALSAVADVGSIPTVSTSPPRKARKRGPFAHLRRRRARVVPASGEQRERLDMPGADRREVTAVDGGNFGDVEPLGSGDHRGVDGSEPEVAVGGYELGEPEPVACRHGLDRERAGGEVSQEADLGLGAEPGGQQVRDLGDDEDRDDQRAGMCLEQLERCLVVSVVAVDVGVERPGVDEQGRYRRTSAARISSIRSETSCCPLRPALAAPSRRRPPDPTR